jgi:hypothetical protein
MMGAESGAIDPFPIGKSNSIQTRLRDDLAGRA